MKAHTGKALLRAGPEVTTQVTDARSWPWVGTHPVVLHVSLG